MLNEEFVERMVRDVCQAVYDGFNSIGIDDLSNRIGSEGQEVEDLSGYVSTTVVEAMVGSTRGLYAIADAIDKMANAIIRLNIKIELDKKE